jgi:hypothetical protein
VRLDSLPVPTRATAVTATTIFRCDVCGDSIEVLPGVVDPPLPMGWQHTSDGLIVCDKHDGLPYPWCRGNPTMDGCRLVGYCQRNPSCGD